MKKRNILTMIIVFFLFMTGWLLWQNKALGITECKPDIIAITGDFIDCRNPNVDIAMKFILGAVDIAPVYYVPGNHECVGNSIIPLRINNPPEIVVVQLTAK